MMEEIHLLEALVNHLRIQKAGCQRNQPKHNE